MFSRKYDLWTKEEYTYPVTGQFIPNIVSYIHEENEESRPAVIVVPGGGYRVVSPTEGELVAKDFYHKGFNTFVLTYTTNLLFESPLKMQPLMDLSNAVMFLRKHAEELRVIPDKISICGFSAGGHLSGSLAVHFDNEDVKLKEKYGGIDNRPNAVILSYPVITSGDYAHQDSFKALLGANPSQEELSFMSLEKQGKDNTPPIFIWHTAADELVPVENSYLFAEACRSKGVKLEHHVFGNGKHGLSLANEAWIKGEWAYKEHGQYTITQMLETLEHHVEKRIELPSPYSHFNHLPEGRKEVKQTILADMKASMPATEPDEGIAVWPELAHHWLKKNLNL
ncbi:alpha/beta hydrolase [Alkalicoccus daliensis]|uniref:Alpha/beta hydrolase family protein n=1 Tax=Alkalicoccus daliensis TaxID=745820 RepID=A0A1H0E7K6_9BACI|nr:alpha/beta hydrolase [Alkalicoccus daliensis]SDN78349.1 Alpha/beta hydrolase family protein [Alkalicoccus daliensis]